MPCIPVLIWFTQMFSVYKRARKRVKKEGRRLCERAAEKDAAWCFSTSEDVPSA